MKLLIIGNGFDLDLGLNTSYLDFYNHSTFSKSECTIPNSLEDFLKGERDVVIRWADLEESMAEYVENKNGELYETILEHDKFFLKQLKYEFSEYIIANWVRKTSELYKTPVKESLAKQLIKIQNKTHCFDAIYSFNCLPYIDLEFASNTEIESLHNVLNVHGAYDEFVFGIRKEDCTREEYSFLVKENQDNYPFEVADNLRRDLLLAEDVVIFGHSLNRIDMVYFEQFFNSQSKLRTITIIDRNGKSFETIKKNISDYAIPLNELQRNSNVSFISTEGYETNKSTGIVDELFNNLNRT